METKMEDLANEIQPLDFRNYLPSFEGKKDSSSTTHQPLDFRSRLSLRSSLKEPSPLEEKEPVLDLSCKKTLILATSSENDVREVTQNILESSTETRLSTDVVKTNRRTDSKSLFEGRSFMVTPPSESESPKKIKFKEDSGSASIVVDDNVDRYSLLPINVPIVPPILPTLLTANSNGMTEKVRAKIQSPTTTTPTMSTNAVSPAETPRKIPRPFKAYPLALTVNTPDMIYNQNSNETYSEFRSRMLENVRRQNETTNLKMRRSNKNTTILPTSTVDEKDAAYWERRKKNNEAAKRSRDARRAKEDEIAIRAAFLEQENIRLKYELAALRNETAKLKCMIYST
ncbi:transcription factor VBP-like isoform X1 [Vespa mandarinia]|uniref:transcription factor VBP-like isoform X1 n=1 Tax=Vespa mandarinia TaxID=7446 RepID=UPI001614F6E6|nr:transcription factor VBP-like isoform X1 [Vespa mandarinia]XP_035738490.1 transcription factor VBP-like isoform X1 [Vespa mandarinia]XP_035738491.1 transcription factor VBP-like isoform X1 [Vespa mandarinia]XP_035738492.1 transcription factor VBP-like isoform X1 [Vespa mandarinia]XP_035738493.1 transcription factor VBP-like isoform X1 [Vespa mandarinia]XP_035738494.1 transcription factor VBP-like isoform X1 [Vespa mandarinia]